MTLFSAQAAGPPHPGRSDVANAAERSIERIVLVEPPGLFRDGLAYAVATFLDEVSVECYDDVADVGVGPASLCLIGVETGEAGRETLLSAIAVLRALCGDAPIGAVIPDDRAPIVHELGGLGVVGVISRAAGLAVAVAAARLMAVGGYCLPPGLGASVESARCALTSAAASPCPRRTADAEGGLVDERTPCRAGLTARECDVLHSLRAGHPNKIIAFELGISESTVKVHLRSIMKKMRASNRTQVALETSFRCERGGAPSRAVATARDEAEDANEPRADIAPLTGERGRVIRLPI